MPEPQDFAVRQLGEAVFDTPLKKLAQSHFAPIRFTTDDQRIPYDVDLRDGFQFRADLSFERGGPREKLYFDPAHVRAAIVTCGGLCPGINNVIRSIVMQLRHGYGCPEVFGVHYGYRGLQPSAQPQPSVLNPDMVSEIHKQGGTFLGSSRGPVDPKVMVDFLRSKRIQILFTIGGDGTQRGALDLANTAYDQGYELAVIGVPKTIDNDIPYVFRTFGHLTAVEEAVNVIEKAHYEARGCIRGVGLVKLMGRHAGYIAANATLGSQEVNFCLIPEVPFHLEGPSGLFDQIEKRIGMRRHAVIVVAEGAGQDLLGEEAGAGTDASGNRRLGDIGPFLAREIRKYFNQAGKPVDLKYIDPSYIIRSAPANVTDALFCDQLARNAVHAGLAGKTGIVIGNWHGVSTHVPISMVARERRYVTEDGELWQSVLRTTGQPARIGSAPVEEPH